MQSKLDLLTQSGQLDNSKLTNNVIVPMTPSPHFFKQIRGTHYACVTPRMLPLPVKFQEKQSELPIFKNNHSISDFLNESEQSKLQQYINEEKEAAEKNTPKKYYLKDITLSEQHKSVRSLAVAKKQYDIAFDAFCRLPNITNLPTHEIMIICFEKAWIFYDLCQYKEAIHEISKGLEMAKTLERDSKQDQDILKNNILYGLTALERNFAMLYKEKYKPSKLKLFSNLEQVGDYQEYVAWARVLYEFDLGRLKGYIDKKFQYLQENIPLGENSQTIDRMII